ncbi:hypothetical protein Kisp02_22040 [Kineosporia sp. NBRC 101731]|nr:hypothetical protein Kisp02_22040 [Kineosporia sp. NBRC 101731]
MISLADFVTILPEESSSCVARDHEPTTGGAPTADRHTAGAGAIKKPGQGDQTVREERPLLSGYKEPSRPPSVGSE